MKLAFSTLGCPAWSLRQVIEAAGRQGCDGVDTRSFFPHPDAAARETAVEEAKRSIEPAARLAAPGIRVFRAHDRRGRGLGSRERLRDRGGSGRRPGLGAVP